MQACTSRFTRALLAGSMLFAAMNAPAQSAPPAWMNRSLSPDQRAELVLKELTLEEKIFLLHGSGRAGASGTLAGAQSNGGAGMFGGVARLNIPPIQMADASYGVTHGKATGRYATAMPSTLAATASWDPRLAFAYGAQIGAELRAHGYNMSLGGGVNLTREPRNGRTFEYQGEDPLLAGTMVGQTIRGVQSQHLIGEIKHFALNDQESGRNAVDITIGERAMRETDLRAFEIGIRTGEPGAVMCSYNRVGGVYACENQHLMGDILKGEWGFKGFVLSDWGGTHSTVKASHAGLDNEEPNSLFFGEPLLKAVKAGEVSLAEIDDHARRILRTEFASGVIDYPISREVVDVEAGLKAAQTASEQSIVLLKNRDGLLPLDVGRTHNIVVIGLHADVGMISGGGSAQVDPPGGNAVPQHVDPLHPPPMFMTQTWFPSSPLKALRARFPEASISFDSGEDRTRAAKLAKAADVAIVFAYQWEAESMDLSTLALAGDQNELIDAVATANAHTVVVLETGGPVTMPWVEKPAAIVETWYAGSSGATAVARVLAGDVNPAAKLPITFPLSDADLPHPTIVMPPQESRPAPIDQNADISTIMARAARILAPFPVQYDEGLRVGYAWFDAEKKDVLFPFGYGLSYTQYAYAGLKLERKGNSVSLSFRLTNTGKREGSEIVEVYASLPASAGEPPKRLVAWRKEKLAAGASTLVTVDVDPSALSIYDVETKTWKIMPGAYVFSVAASSRDMRLSANSALEGGTTP